jgi:hypothetical protein
VLSSYIKVSNARRFPRQRIANIAIRNEMTFVRSAELDQCGNNKRLPDNVPNGEGSLRKERFPMVVKGTARLLF